jgi:Dolichyl-phosphate-mannose-protein mannosyltransferase
VNKKKPAKHSAPKLAIPEKGKRDYYLVFLFIMIAFISIIRYRLIGVFIERDEGEYAYIGNLFLSGVSPFKDGYSMKLPGTSFMYAVFMFLFGRTDTGIHFGLLVMNAATMYLLYAAFKKILTPFIGLATATIYGFMAIGFPFIGFAAHATHFICFYSALALLFLAHFMKSGKQIKLFFIGLMLGMAFLMKQQAIFLILFVGLFLLFYLKTEKKQPLSDIIKKLSIFGSGVIIPYVLIFIIILCTGQFHTFWLWTVQYASQYEGVKGIGIISIYFKSSFVPAWLVYNYLWILALAGTVVLFWTPYTRLQKLFVAGYFLASACVVSSGFYFRPHYYVVILPAIGLLSGVFIEFLVKQLRERIPILKSYHTPLVILSILVLITVFNNSDYFFSYSAKRIGNIAFWGNPFSEAQTIAKYIKENTNDTDKIAVLGSEPEIYFYSNRKAATGYLYTYPLMDKQPNNRVMQQQMISEIEKNKPAVIIFCNIAYSWIVFPGTPRDIFDWGNTYTHDNYTPVAFVDFYIDSGWQFFWGDAIKNRTKQPKSFMIIFKRNPDKGSLPHPS